MAGDAKGEQKPQNEGRRKTQVVAKGAKSKKQKAKTPRPDSR